jgi:circadian clock protein KaiC
MAVETQRTSSLSLPKAPSGIRGLDEITRGGLPRGRPTLVCGGAGCGKTLLAMEFLVRGATEHDEPGVFVSFEETPEDLAANVRSLGFDVQRLIEEDRLSIDHVRVERSEIEETGEYDLDGLFIRLGHAIDTIGAKRVVLDTLETLFSGLSNETVLRSELRRLFQWLKDKSVTAIITGERGHGTLTRQGLEEYVSDCVIVLDHRVVDNFSTRRMRIVKYRGSVHGTNEYPFLIDATGIVVLPITSMSLDHRVSNERVSTGIPRLDAMLGGRGFYRGSSVLVSGTAGTGKTTLASHIADASCRRGERCLYLGYEEAASQLVRNMESVGLDLSPWMDEGLLHVHATRPTAHGLEAHLITVHRLVEAVEPGLVVMDPVTALLNGGSATDAQSMLTRTLDFLKSKQITAVLTSLVRAIEDDERSRTAISSLIDTWIGLQNIEVGGERNRGINVLKSRGMPHSNQIREFLVTENGVEIQDVYVGPEGVLTGSMRLAQEARERAAAVATRQGTERKRRQLERRRQVLEAEIASKREQFAVEEEEMKALLEEDRASAAQMDLDRTAMRRSRRADPAVNGGRPAQRNSRRKASERQE